MVLIHVLGFGLSTVQFAFDGSLGTSDTEQCCRPTIDALSDLLFVRLHIDLIVKFTLSATIAVTVWEQIKQAWRTRLYENLAHKIKKAIDKAVRTVGAGGTSAATSAYRVLVEDLTALLGPLAPLLAGHSAHHGWIGSLASIVDQNAAKNKLDLQLVQVSHCQAKTCKRLGAPFDYNITISATAADTTPHAITTVRPPTITPAEPMGPPPWPPVNSRIDITETKNRRFPIGIGNSSAFVEVDIKDVDGKARIICDCPTCGKLEDLIRLTGAVPHPPGPAAPVGPVLSQPFNRATGDWPGLKKRSPNDGELDRFYGSAISELHANWNSAAFVKVLRELHTAMHSHR